MPIHSICTQCGRSNAGPCTCIGAIRIQRNAEQRRLDRRRTSGRNTTAWLRTRSLVLARDEHTCECGQPATSVHRIAGGYHDGNPDAYVSLCASCHGRIDGAKASA